MTATYLLEIGTEELPAGFLASSRTELPERMAAALTAHRLAHGTIEILQTPRRLTLLIHDLAETQTSADEVIKGPPVSVGLDADGKPTPAAAGFARKNGIDAADLKRETIDGADYLVYHKHSEGRPVASVLPELIPDAVLGLSGSHFMSWDTSLIRFSRPIRWVVSLMGDKPVPLSIGLTASGNTSRGHRFLAAQAEVTIPDAASYTRALWQHGHVLADPTERRKLIAEQLTQTAADLGGTVADTPENDDLLDTVTMLVESPALIAGNFEERFLTLPKPVITTVMAAHQKYFAVEDKTGALLPRFITIANNTRPEAADSIRHGNETVLRARLEDASFFYQEDAKHRLEDLVAQLDGMTFQKGLGSLGDKTRRVQTLTGDLASLMGLSESDTQAAVRGAQLCKADLVTHLVRELTELQGAIGGGYARRDSEPEATAAAIEAHYYPRFPGDAVAAQPAAIALALADKLDTMIAVFAQKDARQPTGSKDPMGLRRMAMGVMAIVLENNLKLDLDLALSKAYKALGSLAVAPEEDAVSATRQFMLQRLRGILLDRQFSYDLIDAVLEADIAPFTDLPGVIARLGALKTLVQSADFKPVYEAANRTGRILGAGYSQDATPERLDPNYLQEPTEKALAEGVKAEFDVLETSDPDALTAVYRRLEPAVTAFFDAVLVNADDPALKQNRYRLLSCLNRLYRRVADFTKLVV